MTTYKTQVRLTPRGRFVRAVAIALALYFTFAWLNDVTTPEKCKVAIEEMSAECKRFLYP
jgi:hypothetical protein